MPRCLPHLARMSAEARRQSGMIVTLVSLFRHDTFSCSSSDKVTGTLASDIILSDSAGGLPSFPHWSIKYPVMSYRLVNLRFDPKVLPKLTNRKVRNSGHVKWHHQQAFSQQCVTALW